MGYSTADGVRISIEEGLNPVYSDEKGPFVPSEIIRQGSIATIEFDLLKWDDVQVSRLEGAREGGTPGANPTCGTLMFQGGLTNYLRIENTCDALTGGGNASWNFNRAYLDGPFTEIVYTQSSVWTARMVAVPDGTSNAGLGYTYYIGGNP